MHRFKVPYLIFLIYFNFYTSIFSFDLNSHTVNTMKSLKIACKPRNLKKYKYSTKMSYDFFNKIGRPKYISAPMVDQSSVAWRQLVRRYDVGLAFTPMIHAKSFVISARYRRELMDWLDSESKKPKESDAPLVAQFAGDCPKILVKAGKYVENCVDAIDLNLGCPQKIAKKGNYGAYLLTSNPDLVFKILKSMSENLRCPITAKIRKLSNENDEETIKFCQEVEKCGVQMLTIHGRTIDSCNQYTGSADWNIIRRVKSLLTIPVIANGGISSLDDVRRCLNETKADGVMSSEALLENPRLFSLQGDHEFKTDYIRSQISVSRELIDLFKRNCMYSKQNQLRGHLFKILYRLLDADKNEDLRTQLASGDFHTIEETVNELDRRFSVIGYLDNDETIRNGLIVKTTWYNRYRDERALTRVITPQKLSAPVSVADTPETVQQKLELLRLRLKERLTNKTESVLQ